MSLYSSVEAVLVGLDWIDAADCPGFAHHTAKREIETTADFQNPNKHDQKRCPAPVRRGVLAAEAPWSQTLHKEAASPENIQGH